MRATSFMCIIVCFALACTTQQVGEVEPPSLLIVVPSHGNGPGLQWSIPAKAERIDVYQSYSEEFTNAELVYSGLDRALAFKNQKTDRLLYFRVKAVFPNRAESWSRTVSFNSELDL